jgi:uncharacterized repeat protein (TIGR01451 family)
MPAQVNTNFQLAIGDVLSCTLTNTRDPATVDLVVDKTMEVVSDPVRNRTNPLAIPGARIRYSLTVTNRGDGPVDADSLILDDTLPANFHFDGAVPVSFIDGSTASGLDPFDAATMVSFAASTSGPFVSVAPGGVDPSVRAIRIAPTGQLAAAAGSDRPGFTITFEGVVP